MKPAKATRFDHPIPYNCDPLANKRAIARVNELSRRGHLTGTREQAIEAVLQMLDAAVKQAKTKNSGTESL